MSLLENEWYIQAPWGRIAIIAWGNCYDPPVVLCHGVKDSAVSFRPLVNQLPKGYYYIGIDLPGHGRSDSFPPGLMISIYDIAYAVKAVVKHFRWQTFIYIGHSFGAVLGKIYNICYPGNIEKLIELDPINFFAITPENFSMWYNYFFVDFFKNYDKVNSPKENASTLKWTEALSSLMKKRPALNEEQAAAVLERLSEPAGDGLIRYTFDRRNQYIHGPPLSPEHIKNIYTSINTPTLFIITEESIKKEFYKNNTDFLLDTSIYPNNNLRVITVKGEHDVHISHPERLAPFLAQFLANGVAGIDKKSKL